jgi:hypothetical protein
VETVSVRLKKEEREALEAFAAELSEGLGLPVSLADAFVHILKHLPQDAAEHPGWVAGGPSTGVFAMNLEVDQVAMIDTLAEKLAERRARLLGGEQSPVRSEAIRFAIRAGTRHLTRCLVNRLT